MKFGSLVLCALTSFGCAHGVVESPSIVDRTAPVTGLSVIVAAAVDAKQVNEAGLVELRAKNYKRSLEIYTKGWDAGARSAPVAYNGACAAALLGNFVEAWMWLDRLEEQGGDVWNTIYSDDDLKALRDSAELDKYRARRAEVQKASNAKRVGLGLVSATPTEEGLDEAVLAALTKQAQATASASVVILRHGRLVFEWHELGYSERTQMMSATKSIVALGIAALATDGKLKFDDPVWKLFKQWRQGRKEQITLRHLLNHTSGLQALRDTRDIYRAPDFVQLALAAELSDDPGQRFFYNNKAVNLLAGVIEKVSGKKMDAYLADRLFTPMGITDFRWQKDNAGTPQAMAGLKLHAADAAKLGQLMLQRGRYGDSQLISAELIAELLKPGQAENPGVGLLWWLNYERKTVSFEKDAFKKAQAFGLSAATAKKLEGLDAKVWEGTTFYEEQDKRLSEEESDELYLALEKGKLRKRNVEGALLSYEASGYLGQYIVVVPGAELVAVRWSQQQKKLPDNVDFNEFVPLLLKLVPKSATSAVDASH